MKFKVVLVNVAGGDIRQKLEFHHVHLELGALGYIETFLFYWSWVFFQKKTHHGRFPFFESTLFFGPPCTCFNTFKRTVNIEKKNTKFIQTIYLLGCTTKF